MADDLDLEIEIARARAKAKRAKAAASGVTVDGLPAFSETSVETPQGAQRMVNGQPVLSVDELKQRLAGQDAAAKLEAYKALLAGIQGPANFLTDRVAGLKAAAQALPKWMEGDGRDLGDIYAKGRDDARKVVDESVRAYPMAPLVGSVVTAPFSPVAGSSVGRVLSTGYQSGLGGFGASRGGDQLGDTLKGVGLGVGVAGGMELAGKGFNAIAQGAQTQAAAVEAAKKAEIEAKIAKEIESLAGKVRGETQVGSRYGENTQRAIAGVPKEGAPVVSEALQAEASEAMASPAMKALQEKVLSNTLKNAPGQLAKIEGLESELATKVAGAGQEAADRTAAYFDAPVWTEMKPKLQRLGVRAGVAGGTAALGQGLSAITGDDTYGKYGVISALSQVGLPGSISILQNSYKSPRVQKATLDTLMELSRGAASAAPRLGGTATQAGAQSAAWAGRPGALQGLQQWAGFGSSGEQPPPTNPRTAASASLPALPEPYAAPQSRPAPWPMPSLFGTTRQTAPQSPPNATPSDTSAPDAGFEDLKKRLGIDGREKLSEQHYLGQ